MTAHSPSIRYTDLTMVLFPSIMIGYAQVNGTPSSMDQLTHVALKNLDFSACGSIFGTDLVTTPYLKLPPCCHHSSIRVGTAPGDYSKGIARVRKLSDGSVSTPGVEVGQMSEINWADGDYVTFYAGADLFPRNTRYRSGSVTTTFTLPGTGSSITKTTWDFQTGSAGFEATQGVGGVEEMKTVTNFGHSDNFSFKFKVQAAHAGGQSLYLQGQPGSFSGAFPVIGSGMTISAWFYKESSSGSGVCNPFFSIDTGESAQDTHNFTDIPVGVWTQLSWDVSVSHVGEHLSLIQLGISTTLDKLATYYIDDITITGWNMPDPGIWRFERFDTGLGGWVSTIDPPGTITQSWSSSENHSNRYWDDNTQTACLKYAGSTGMAQLSYSIGRTIASGDYVNCWLKLGGLGYTLNFKLAVYNGATKIAEASVDAPSLSTSAFTEFKLNLSAYAGFAITEVRLTATQSGAGITWYLDDFKFYWLNVDNGSSTTKTATDSFCYDYDLAPSVIDSGGPLVRLGPETAIPFQTSQNHISLTPVQWNPFGSTGTLTGKEITEDLDVQTVYSPFSGALNPTTGGAHVITLDAGNPFWQRTYRYYVLDDDHPGVKDFQLEEFALDEFGWSFKVTCFDPTVNVEPYQYVMLCGQHSTDDFTVVGTVLNPWAAPGMMIGSGWVDGDSIQYTPEKNGLSFTVRGLPYWLQNLTSQPFGIQNVSGVESADGIVFVKDFTLEKAAVLLSAFHSTVACITDVVMPSMTDIYPILSAPPGAVLWDQLTSVFLNPAWLTPHTNCWNQLYLDRDPNLVPVASRGSIYVWLDLDNGSWTGTVNLRRVVTPPCSLLEISGFTLALDPLIICAPGISPKRWGKTRNQQQFWFKDQAEALFLAGALLAKYNNKWDIVNISIPDYVRVDVPFGYITWLLPADNRFGLPQQTLKMIARKVKHAYDNKEGFFKTEIEAEVETTPDLSANVDVPKVVPAEPPKPVTTPTPPLPGPAPSSGCLDAPGTPNSATMGWYQPITMGESYTFAFACVVRPSSCTAALTRVTIQCVASREGSGLMSILTCQAVGTPNLSSIYKNVDAYGNPYFIFSPPLYFNATGFIFTVAGTPSDYVNITSITIENICPAGTTP